MNKHELKIISKLYIELVMANGLYLCFLVKILKLFHLVIYIVKNQSKEKLIV